MKLVQAEFLPRQATLYKYYALVTGIDCNPYNGPETRATYDAIKHIIQERSSLAEEICIRIFDNESAYKLSTYTNLGDDIEVQVLLFGVFANNNGWSVDTLKKAFQREKVPTIMRPEIGAYSFNWYTADGNPTFQVYLKNETTGVFEKLDRRHLRLSSESPTPSVGRLNDYWIVSERNTLTHYIKTDKGWENVTQILDVTSGDTQPKPDAKVWFKNIAMSAQQITSDGWNPTRRMIKMQNINDMAEPAASSSYGILTMYKGGSATTFFTLTNYSLTGNNRQGQCSLAAIITLAKDEECALYGTLGNGTCVASASTNGSISITAVRLM